MNILLTLEELEARLMTVEREQLHHVLLGVLKRNPSLIAQIANELAALPVSTAVVANSAPHIDIDINAVLSALAHLWPHSVDALLQQSNTFLDTGNAHNALALLGALTPAHIEYWLECSDKGADCYFEELGRAWTEALLCVTLDKHTRMEWQLKLEDWDALMSEHGGEFGLDDSFKAAIAAAEHGWEYPPLQQVLQGNIPPHWEGEAPWCGDALVQTRLRILNAQNRYAEYLHLALAEKQIASYVLMLIQRGHTRQAVDAALEQITDSRAAYQVARALYSHHKISESFRIGEHGLNFDDFHLARLARWLYETACKHHRIPLALKAGEIACRLRPNLALYRRLEAQAKDAWPSIRANLLAAFHHYEHQNQESMAILQYENRIEHAA
jgi:hypothetical protein